MSQLARWCDRNRRRVVALWLAGLVAVGLAGSMLGGAFQNDFRVAGAESQASFELLKARFPEFYGDPLSIAFKAKAGVADPAVQSEMERFFAEIATLDGVRQVISPYGGGLAPISRDGTIGLAQVQLESFGPSVAPPSSETSSTGPTPSPKAPASRWTWVGPRRCSRSHGRSSKRSPGATYTWWYQATMVDWMRQAAPAIDPAVVAIEEAIVVIVRAASLPRVQDRFVAQSGVAIERAAYGVLREVAEQGSVRPTELANSFGLDLSTVSRQVKGLESAGLLARAGDPGDRRAACLTATPDGVEALARLRQVRHRFFEGLLANWPVEDRDRLAPLLERLAHEFRALGGQL